jgi:xanthine dehydrogenase YagR molybdenum-binding subunit
MKKENEVYYTKDIPVPETPAAGKEPDPWGETRIIGERVPRVDGYERVSGAAVYPSDVILPNMLHAAILRCPHPHAMVRKVDISKAKQMPGVRAILTNDSPEADLMWPYSDEAKTRLFDPHCRFEGETVAAVAADTPYQAWDAVHAIKVSYDVKNHVVDEQEALTSSVSIHDGGNKVKTQSHSRGDTRKGFQEADVVLEESYHAACEIHTPMELHGCVASWDGDALTIRESTQGVYAVQSRVAEVLGMPLSKVRVIGHYMGGGFGSKLQADKYTIIAALLAKKTGRPVKLFLSREETYLAVGNRPPTKMTLKAGVKKDGTLTAFDFTCTGASGAYPAGGTALVDWLIRDLYKCPNVKTECTDVYINTGPARPFRAPGHPQASWALEQMMDALAEKIGMDPVAFRLKNIPEISQGRERPYTTTGLKECITQGTEAFGWEKARKAAEEHNKKGGRTRRGVGMGSCVWFVGGGGPPSTVVIKLFSDGSVNLNMGASDIGTGTKTIMALVAAEELGVKPEVIQIENADTGTTQYATPSGGSKTVPTEAPTVRSAAIAVKQELLKMAAEELGTDVADLRFDADDIVSAKEGSKKINIKDLSELKKRGVVMGVGHRGPNPENKSVNPFAAQFCEVEVNPRTGEIKILRFLGTNESGRVMDRLTFDGQVFGGITMGVGFGMTEWRVLDHGQTGKMLNKNWHDYKLPTALDVPMEMTSVPIEMPDPEANNTGAKGLGEPVTIPTGGAIANAVYHATGIRMTDTPINPVTLNRKYAEEEG